MQSVNQDDEHAPKSASVPFNEEAADVILRTSDNIDFHVYRAILGLASPFFKTMFTLQRPPEHAEECSYKLAKMDPIPVTEESIILDHLLRLCYPVREPVISDLTLLGRVLEAAIKYDIDAVTHTLREKLLKSVGEAPLQVYAIACGLHLEDEARAAATAYQLQQKPWLELERKGEGVATSFGDTLAGHVYDPCLKDLSAGAYYRLLTFLRTTDSALSFCDPTTETSSYVCEDLQSDLFKFEDSDVTLQSQDGVEFHIHRLILQLSSATQLLTRHAGKAPRDPRVDGRSVIDVDLDAWTLFGLLRACYPPMFHAAGCPAQQPLPILILRAAKHYKIEGILMAARSSWSLYVQKSSLSAYFFAVELGWACEAEVAARQLAELEISELYVPEMETTTAEVYHRLLQYHYRCYEAVRTAVCHYYEFGVDQWPRLRSSQSITNCVPSLTTAMLWPTVEYNELSWRKNDNYTLHTMNNPKKYNDTIMVRVGNVLDNVPFYQDSDAAGKTNPP